MSASYGITLGGQTLGPETITGLPVGAPQRVVVVARAGSYSVRVPAASAAILTVPPR
jgi:hypothetical protein